MLIQVQAVPFAILDGDKMFGIECSDCGVLFPSVEETEIHDICVAHLRLHNVDVTAYEED